MALASKSDIVSVLDNTSLAVPPLRKEEGSGMAPLTLFFFSPEILGNMNMQIIKVVVM